jgi:epoxyqueuosine reductase
MALKNEIAAEARRLGFNLFGVVEPVRPPHFEVYISWIARGCHGEMGYLATDRAIKRRKVPGLILPGCQSILVLGWPHRTPPLHTQAAAPDDSELRGSIAAYAWSEDYHDVIPARLEALAAFIETRVGGPVPNRWYTDTGPILERDLAQLAGLGWIGKNTCLINPGQGSYFLLAELFLGIKLEPDSPFKADRCGTCTRCIEACPTACIQEDRTLDASKCISYLTIELKGSISRDLRPQIGNWIFGCDICQQVCPWNQRFAEPSAPDPVDAEAIGPDLIKELPLTGRDFNRKFKGKPVKRTRRRGYLRNVAVALGNSGSSKAIPGLVYSLLNDPETLVREHAAWALGRFDQETARLALQDALQTEEDPAVLAEIRYNLDQ